MAFTEIDYNITVGVLKIKLTYFDINNRELNLGVINIGELEYGYEDEDQLTFFPNIFRIEFTDFDRINYEVLKKSLDRYPLLDYKACGRVEVWLKKFGAANFETIYDGFIDNETLSYDEKSRVTSFEAVDFILDLKNITTYDLRSDPGMFPPKLENVPYVLWRIYKNIYPEMPEPTIPSYGITNQISMFNDELPNMNPYKGIYWKHNWKFTGHNNYSTPTGFSYNETSADWSTDYFKPVFAFFKYFWNERYEMYTLADLIKQLSKEFGAVIGSTVKNKVFFIKRYPDYGSVKEPLDGKIIEGTLSKTLYLRKVASVKNQNELFGTTKSFTFDENPDRPGYPKKKEDNLEIKTYFGTMPSNPIDMTDGWQTSVRLTHTDGNIYKVGRTITDPDFSVYEHPQPWTLQTLITEYVYNSRQKNRDKYEMELMGINYDIFKSYSVKDGFNHAKTLRPMLIKKNLLKNTTQMTALEVGL